MATTKEELVLGKESLIILPTYRLAFNAIGCGQETPSVS